MRTNSAVAGAVAGVGFLAVCMYFLCPSAGSGGQGILQISSTQAAAGVAHAIPMAPVAALQCNVECLPFAVIASCVLGMVVWLVGQRMRPGADVDLASPSVRRAEPMPGA